MIKILFKSAIFKMRDFMILNKNKLVFFNLKNI